jgi:hypothetical protein
MRVGEYVTALCDGQPGSEACHLSLVAERDEPLFPQRARSDSLTSDHVDAHDGRRNSPGCVNDRG